MNMMCPFKPRWERRKEARPQELLDAALDHFAMRGFAATKLDDVARSAGVSKGTLYLYYSSKEELFKAVVRESIVSLIGRTEGMIEQFTGSSEELFVLVMRTWWDNMGATKLSALPKLMMAEGANFPELAQFYQEEVVDRGERLVANMLQRGIARGEVIPMDLPVATKVLISPMIMMMLWKHAVGVCQVAEDRLPAHLDCYISLALRSILKQAPAEGLPKT